MRVGEANAGLMVVAGLDIHGNQTIKIIPLDRVESVTIDQETQNDIDKGHFSGIYRYHVNLIGGAGIGVAEPSMETFESRWASYRKSVLNRMAPNPSSD